VEKYPHAALGRLGWFVPLEFGLAGVASAIGVSILERAFGPGLPPAWTWWERLREVLLLTGLYVTSVGANGASNVTFAIGLLAVVAGRLAFAPVRGDWAFALAAAIAGPAVEAVIHALGAFDYTEPDFLGLPIWLPALWANGGLAIRRLFGPLARSAVPEPHEAAQGPYVG
jgi:Protein of unknown function (DUF2878)